MSEKDNMVSKENMDSHDYESIVIGSGFGGAVSSLRQSQKWPGKVLLVERGKSYPMGSFPRSPYEFETKGFFTLDENTHKRSKVLRKKATNGLFDIRNYEDMDVVLAAGLGGGSLIYANVLLEPPEDVLEKWPKNFQKNSLMAHYRTVKKIMHARKLPEEDGKDWKLDKLAYYREGAKALGRKSELVDLAVYFGPGHSKPDKPGVQSENAFGAKQTSCTLCAECDVGCNVHAKNTLDLNYIYAARKEHGLNVRTDTLATKVSPVDRQMKDSSEERGQFGYRVYFKNLVSGEEFSHTTKRVTLSAGTLGSNELLLRCRDEHKTLPALSKKLGTGFSGNGDFLSIVFDNKKIVNPNKGPVITQRIDFDLFYKTSPQPSGRFILEDASFPAFLSWFVEGMRPVEKSLILMKEVAFDFMKRTFGIATSARLSATFQRSLSDEVSKRASVHLCMGLDASDGRVYLDDGKLELEWDRKKSMGLYEKIILSVKSFKKIFSGAFFVPVPAWGIFSKKNVTVHALGGCHLAANENEGVVSAVDDGERRLGELFGYKNFFVADGSVLPSAVGANPSLTIAAVAEKINASITSDSQSQCF